MKLMSKINEAVSYMIETGLRETTYGNWNFSYEEVEKATGFKITEENINEVVYWLSNSESVADIEVADKTIDIIFYTDYIEGYYDNEEDNEND